MDSVAATCVVSRRVRFYKGAPEERGNKSPGNGTVLAYLGADVAAFLEAFHPFGMVCSRLVWAGGDE